MYCPSFESGDCASCPQIREPYTLQLQTKQQRVAALLPTMAWLAPVPSAEQGFRNKAKMVVSGDAQRPVLGIINAQGGVDLSGCLLYPAAFQQAFAAVIAFIRTVNVPPYDVSSRQGELKYVLFTQSDVDGWLVRFVLRSQRDVAALRKHLPKLFQSLPDLRVVTANIQPDHKAVLEGDTEIVLSSESMLSMQLNDVSLYLQPQSFFQTNSAVAAALYQAARDWVAPLPVRRIWDLFCGVGGFALHLVDGQREVTGIEISASAIACASRAAAELGYAIDFRALDATAFALSVTAGPELLVVNPPRRGLGQALCLQIEQLKPAYVLYSSCNPHTLSDDLRLLSSYQPMQAQLFDMFAHTEHAEVLVLLQRMTA